MVFSLSLDKILFLYAERVSILDFEKAMYSCHPDVISRLYAARSGRSQASATSRKEQNCTGISMSLSPSQHGWDVGVPASEPSWPPSESARGALSVSLWFCAY